MPRHDRSSCLVRVTRAGYEPVNDWDHEIHARFREGDVVEIAPFKPRTRKQDGFYWSMLDVVAQNQTRFPHARAISNAILVELGYDARWTDLRGAVHAEPMSIGSFDKDEMSVLIDQAKQVIVEMIIPGVDLDALLAEAWGKERP